MGASDSTAPVLRLSSLLANPGTVGDDEGTDASLETVTSDLLTYPQKTEEKRVYLRTRCGPKPVRFFEPRASGGGPGA